jgi:hypothetical protein
VTLNRLTLGRRDVEFCIELLDYAVPSRGSHLLPLSLGPLPGPIPAQTHDCREAEVIPYLEGVNYSPRSSEAQRQIYKRESAKVILSL